MVHICRVCDIEFAKLKAYVAHTEEQHPESDDSEEEQQGAPQIQLPNYVVEDNPRFRPYQKHIYRQLQEIVAKRPEGCTTLVEACTGSGKGCMVTVFPGALKSRRMLFIVPSSQTRTEAVKKFLGDAGTETFVERVGAIRASEKHLTPRAWAMTDGKDIPSSVPQTLALLQGLGVVITTAQLISQKADRPSDMLHRLLAASQRHLADHGWPLFDSIVYDEGHHAVAKSWRLIKDTLGAQMWEENGVTRRPQIVYLTGTPYRLIKDEDYDEVTDRYTLRTAIKENMAKDVVLLNVTSGANTPNEAVLQVAHVVAHLLRNKRELSHKNIAHKALVMVRGKEVAADMARIVNAARIPLHEMPGGGMRYMMAEDIHGGYRDADRNAKMDRFQARQVFENSTDILFQDSMISEGYDNPLVSVCVILRKCGVVSKLGQFIGRGVRKLQQDFVGQGVAISPADNVCHVVTHAMYDQVQLFFEYVQQHPVNPADDADNDEGPEAVGPVPGSPAVGPVTTINRYLFPVDDAEHMARLLDQEGARYFPRNGRWEVNNVALNV